MPVTLSSLHRAAVCPGSAALPSAGSVGGNLGSAFHEWLSWLVELPDQGGGHNVEELVRRWNLSEDEASILRWKVRYAQPEIPAGALSEVALCLMDDGTVTRVGGARGRYEMPPGGVIAGTIDLLWSEPAPLVRDDDESAWRVPGGAQLWVVDAKTGSERNVERIVRNWQLRAGALIASRWLGTPVRGVVPAVWFAPRSKADPPEGRWDVPAVGLDAGDLNVIEKDVRAVVARVREADARVAAGELPELVTGPQCEHCPARLACPAFGADARAMLAPYTGMSLQFPTVTELSPEQASRAAEMLPVMERASAQMRKLLRSYVAMMGQTIPMSDGRVWGPERVSDATVFDALPTFAALRGALGDLLGDPSAGVEAANSAFKTTKTEIIKAVKEAHKAAGEPGTQKAAIARALEAIERGGGSRKVPAVKWRAHHPGATAALPSIDDVAMDEEVTE